MLHSVITIERCHTSDSSVSYTCTTVKSIRRSLQCWPSHSPEQPSDERTQNHRKDSNFDHNLSPVQQRSAILHWYLWTSGYGSYTVLSHAHLLVMSVTEAIQLLHYTNCLELQRKQPNISSVFFSSSIVGHLQSTIAPWWASCPSFRLHLAYACPRCCQQQLQRRIGCWQRTRKTLLPALHSQQHIYVRNF